MPKNVMKLLKPSPNLGRNSFDLSFRSLFSAKFGELLPVLCQETVPNDTFSVRAADLIRALPMVTSPFLRAKQHLDLWFVPYSALWSRFNEFIVDKDEPSSSALHFRYYLPTVSLHDLVEVSAGDVLDTDVVGMNYKEGAYKLLDLLGYPTASKKFSSWQVGSIDPSLRSNLFRLAAYNYIWYKEYRQQYYDNGQYGLNLPSGKNVSVLWNFDDMNCGSASGAQIEVDHVDYLPAMCQMRYRLWKKDLFTGLLPSTQFGNVSSLSNTLTDFTSKILNQDRRQSSAGTDTDGYLVNGYNQQIWRVQPLGQNTSSISILDLRKAQAVQRWRENALRAGNQIEDNFEAHWGSKPHSHMITHPTHIGSVSAPLNIGDIDSTAQVGSGANQQLADVAGKGISSLDGREFKFSTNDFGIIMGIWSMLPEAEYNTLGVDRANQLVEREDFFVPEYENLGFEAVGTATFDASNIAASYPILGYAPRYWSYKQNHDRVHLSFMNGNFGVSGEILGDFRFWASPKYDVSAALQKSHSGLPLECLYVNPSIFDVNFGTSASTVDQFLVDMFFDIKAVRSMSVVGLPNSI